MTHLVYIGNKLAHKGNTASTIDTLGLHFEDLGYKVTYASSKQRLVSRFIDMLWTVIKQRKTADFVLIDTYSTLNFYYALAVSQLCRVLRLQYIPILHGGNLPNRLNSNPKLSRLLFKHSHVNISPSEYIKHHFEIKGYLCKVIPNSIAISQYEFNSRAIDEVKLLWVRSFSKIYNPTLAVDILDALKAKGYDANLCMVGPEKDGSLEQTKAYAKSKTLDVTFTDGLTKSEWISLSKDYNVFINTTNFDNMPVSVIEAMALGLPVISTNVGGLPFLIHHQKDGLLVPPNQVEGFVNAVQQLKEDHSFLDEMTKHARQKAECYDWQQVKAQWLSILK